MSIDNKVSSTGKSKLLSINLLARLAIGLLFVSVVLWFLDYEEEAVGTQQSSLPILKVSTVQAVPGEHSLKLSVVGTTQPRWPVDLVATVSGRVIKFPEQLEPGSLVEQDQLLLETDDVPYHSAVAESHSRVKQAELQVAQIRHEKTVTEQVSGGKKLSSFGRLEPHLAAAEAALDAAQKSLAESQKNLSETRQLAPFDAILLEKWVVPGQWITTGEQLFRLAASDSIDVKIELSAQQLAQLGHFQHDVSATVLSQNGHRWPATLRYQEPLISQQTRQSRLVLSVTNPYDPARKLYPQSMVTVELKGQAISQVVSAPSTVLTNDGNVWVVENGILRETEVTIIEETDDMVNFKFIDSPSKSRELVRFPLSSMLTGQKVQPVNGADAPTNTENKGALQ